MNIFILLSTLFGWFVMALMLSLYVWRKLNKKASSEQPLDSSYRRLRHTGTEDARRKRKISFQRNKLRNGISIGVVLVAIATSCAPTQQLAAPQASDCQHEYLIDRSNLEEWCRLCGHKN